MEKRKRNGLEVTCIGSLYQGPWEKKYWSSTRGKDRYPYPVGYQAVRCFNGDSYQMEVQEGSRGPLFVVGFGEGMKCSADTPTIAWQDAMKKTSFCSKKTRGRLLSSDINGSELFGFLDPLVQRLFRELISVHEGEAQPDDNACPEKKADDVGREKPTNGCPEGFGWSSTKTGQVRRSRTSIVRTGTKGSGFSGESSLKQSSCVKGHRKRLKLVKPPKRTREKSEVELHDHSLPQFALQKTSQPTEGCTEGSIKITQMQEDVCRSMNVAVLEITKEEMLKDTVIPDSYDDFPSQIYVRRERRIQAKLPPSLNTFDENNNEHRALISDENICLPLVNLSEPVDFEHSHSFNNENGITVFQKFGLNFERKNRDLSSPTKIAPEDQLNNVVVPDSCDIRSQDLSLPTRVLLEKLKNTVVPDSFDMENGSLPLNEAHPPTQGAVVHSQIVLEQPSAEFGKFDDLHSPCAKEESQSSEGNTQKEESDSLGQELTKSMISLLLPQALQILNKRGRKRKEQTTTMNEVELVDFSDVALEPTAVNEKEPCSNSNGVKRQVLEAQSSQCIYNEEQGGSVGEDDGICAETEKNELHSGKVYESNQRLNADNGVHRAALETSHNEHLSDKTTKIDQCKSQLSNNLTCCGETFIDNEPVHQQQAPKDSRHPPLSYTIISSANPTTVDSGPTEFLNKEQVYYANDGQDVSSLSIILKPPFPEVEERRLADHNCEGLCSPLSVSLNIMETKDSVVEGTHTEVEKGTPPRVKNSSMDFVSEHILGFDAKATMEGVPRPITGQKLSAVSEALVKDKVQSMHSVNSTVVSGQLALQEMSNVIDKGKDFSRDFSIEQRSADATEHEAKKHVFKSGAFVPKVCLEHPMPVLAMKITVQDDQARLLVCCGFPDAKRLLLVYLLAGNELLPSLISSTTFDIVDSNSNAVSRGLFESNGIQFTPGGQELLLLGMFKIRETTGEKQASPLDKKDNCLCDIQLISYTVGKLCIASKLSSFGSQLYCVLPVNTCTVIAGGENGLVTGWIMDTSWRSCKERFTLPILSIDGGPSSNIIRLSGVSTLPSIVVGCDGQGSIAIWNFVSRQLLTGSKLSMELPSELHILKMDLVSQSDSVESDWTEGRSSLTERVAAASFLVSTLNCQGAGPQDSIGQCVSRSWTLKLLKKNCTSVVHQQRICTVEVSERLGLAGTSDGCVLLWDTLSGSVMETLRQLKDEPVRCIARDRTCNIMAVAGSADVIIYAKQT